MIVGLLLAALVAVVGVAVLMLSSSSASLSADSQALAKVDMPLGGGKIQSVTVVTGPHAAPVPVDVRGSQIWPQHVLRAHQLVTIDVIVKRPGWNGWFAGKTQHLHLAMYTPSTRLLAHYLTVPAGAPLRLRFSQPVAVYFTGAIGHLERHVLPSPQSTITLARTAAAGSLAIAAVPRPWETSAAATISWFPNGAAAAAVAVPAPGSSILPGTPITLTFNKPVSKALGSDRPPVLARHARDLADGQPAHDHLPPRGLWLRPRREGHDPATERRQAGRVQFTQLGHLDRPLRIADAGPAAAGDPGVPAAELPLRPRRRWP